MARASELDPQEEIARLLATLVRLQVDNQARAILELGKAGFAPARIGALLGTTTDTAKVTLARARKRTASQKG
jgi:DNA-directed RNA polymerase specialized sigma24 family protein